MVIREGSIYWIDFSPGKDSEPMGKRPGLVLQNNPINDSKINTFIILAITSTLRYGDLPGNVTLRKGEANIPKRCVINVSQIKSVDKNIIREKIGTVSKEKMAAVEDGVRLILDL